MTLAPQRNPPSGRTPALPPPVEEPSAAADTFRELFFILRRRKWLMAAIVATVTVAVALYALRLTPLYTATAVVTINERTMQLWNIENVLSGLRSDEETIQTEVQVLTSNRIIHDTVRTLRLDRRPEFNVKLRPPAPPWRQQAAKLAEDFWTLIRTGARPNDATEADPTGIGAADDSQVSDESADELRVMDAVRARLNVTPIGRSRAIAISFTSANAALAEKVANRLADLYLVQQLEAQAQASSSAERWLNDRIAALRSEVEDAERKVEAFRALQTAAVGMAGDDIVEQIKELNTVLVKAQNDYDLQRSKLASIEQAMRVSGPAAAGRLLDSTLMQTLETQLTTLVTQGADLAKRYGPNYPLVIQNAAEQASTNQQIEKELRHILATERGQVQTLSGRVRSLQNQLNALRAHALQAQKSDVTLRTLQREADARRTVLETFLNRSKQLEQAGLQQPDARIVSEAMLPLAPSYPRFKILILVGFALGLGLAVALTAALELLDRGLKSREEVEAHLLVPALGVLPQLARPSLFRRARPQDQLLENPTSAYSESLRGIIATLSLVRRPTAPVTLLFTSTVPKESKSVLVVSLARALAGFGHRVLILDCDLRRPAAHRYLGLPNQRGVAEATAGAASVGGLVQRDARSGVDLLSAGGPRRGQEQIVLGGVYGLLKALREEGLYDCILVDAPPVLAVSDARLITTQVDGCIYAVRWRRTSRQAAQRGISLLNQDGAPVLGVVLTAVDPAVHRKYGICDEGHYPGARSYYVSRP